jgi:hypothetical protein
MSISRFGFLPAVVLAGSISLALPPPAAAEWSDDESWDGESGEEQQEGASAFVAWSDEDFRLDASGAGEVDARVNTPVLAGDIVETSRGRLEIVLPGWSVIRLDRGTRLEFESIAGTAGDSSDRTALRLTKGSIAIDLREDDEWSEGITIGGRENLEVELLRDGSYRIDTDRRGGLTIQVEEGVAEIRNQRDRERVETGESATAGEESRIEVEQERWAEDRFDRWVDQRRARESKGSVSSRYLEGRFSWAASYLDENGSWDWDDDYDCNVWRPRTSNSWRPYSDGRWYYTPAGLTWIAYEPWGWLPSHYGSWVWGRHGWCWIFGDVWSPAWVYWYHTPSWLGWCPTGYYDNYYRRRYFGSHSGRLHFDINAHVGFKQLDLNGWNFLSPDRLGAPNIRNVLIPPGDIRRGLGLVDLDGVVSSKPIRFGGTSRLAPANVIERIRDLTPELIRRAAPPAPGLGDFFRRQRDLPTPALDSLRGRIRVEPQPGDRKGPGDRGKGRVGEPSGKVRPGDGPERIRPGDRVPDLRDRRRVEPPTPALPDDRSPRRIDRTPVTPPAEPGDRSPRRIDRTPVTPPAEPEDHSPRRIDRTPVTPPAEPEERSPRRIDRTPVTPPAEPGERSPRRIERQPVTPPSPPAEDPGDRHIRSTPRENVRVPSEPPAHIRPTPLPSPREAKPPAEVKAPSAPKVKAPPATATPEKTKDPDKKAGAA